MELVDVKGIEIVDVEGYDVPREPERNCATIAASKLLGSFSYNALRWRE